jgi:O-antigen/teichoic acid export membrane protein
MKLKHERPSGLKSGVSSVAGLATPALIYLLITPLLVRSLGAPRYGLLMMFMAVPAFLGNIDFGLGAGGVLSMGRAIETDDTRKAVLLHRELITIFSLLGLVLSAAVWLAAPAIVGTLGMSQAVDEPQARILVHLGACALLLSILTASVSILPRAVEQFPRITLIQVLAKIVLWLGVAALTFRGGGLVPIFRWVLAVEFLVLIVYVAWNMQLLPALSWLPILRFREVRDLISFSSHAFIAQLTSSFAYHMDKFLLAYFLGPASVAYYSVAVGSASKILTLAGVMSAFVFPRAVGLNAVAATDALRALYLRASRFTLLVLAPLLVPGLLLTPALLRVWLGPEFAAKSAAPMQLLIVAYFFSAVSVVPSHIYNGKGNSRISAIYATIGTLMNVSLCVVLIPRFGITGAAAAAVAGAAQSIVFMGSLEHELGLGWFGGQVKLFGQLGLLALVQFAVLTLAGGRAQDWPSLLLVGALGWGLFYALWFLIPIATEDDKAVCVLILRNRVS